MRSRVVRAVGFLVMAVVFIAVMSWVVMSLWNWLVPALFHGPAVEYWQAVGLLLLTRILFGGLRGRGAWHGRGQLWRERWANLTPEERERMREQLRHRCGGASREGEQASQPPTP